MSLKEIKLSIVGMSCSSCSASVERLVDTLDGLESRNISHESDTGTFIFDADILSSEELISKINEGHYKVDIENKQIFEIKSIILACPKCGNSGQLVPNTVFRSNIKADSLNKVNTEIDNYICMDTNCDVAYYNEDNDTLILKNELKRELWYKKGSERIIACYCNNIDTEQLKEAVINYNLTDWDDIMNHYRTKVIEKCEKLNPTGFCCRNTFKGLVEEIQNKL